MRFASVLVFLVATPSARADVLCAYGSESGAIVYTNTPDKSGACAGSASPAPLPQASAGEVGRYDATVKQYANFFGISPRLVHAVIATESAYNPSAISPKGARGLMQLMPATAKIYGVKDLLDPSENIRGGVAHLKDLLDRFGGDTRLAVAAYNAGSGAVARFSGVPPFAETRDYVKRVLGRLGSGGDARTGSLKIEPTPARIEVKVASNGTVSLVN